MNKRILRLAIPNILSNLSVPLLSSVDTAVVGHLDQVYYIGAIAIGSMIFNFIYWGFGFLRMGTTGLTAQAFGKKDTAEISLIFSRSIFIALLSASALILFQNYIAKFSFYLIDASSDVEFYAMEYFYIRIYAAPATLLLYVFHGWFLGMQNARFPLILTIIVNVLNIIFNLVFVYALGMKADGVALGTVIAQYIGLVLAILLYLFKYSDYKIVKDIKKIFELASIKKFLKVNFDIFVRTLFLIFAFSFFTAESATFGDDILAANTILLQLWMILSFGIDGFAFAAESLVGKYFGSRDKESFNKVIKYSFYWGIGLGVILSFVYLIFGKEIVSLYTNNSELITLTMSFFIWTIFAPLVNSICYIWDGVFIGATATKAMRNSMVIVTLFIYLPVYFLTKGAIGNHALWLALSLFMLTRGVSLTLYSKKYILLQDD
ncbi:MAG: MATE family efflux transporter [Melioribacteraceae bacterium]|nr:MATE family efflux transporter [Melioribacteraceae bacterium]